MKYTVKFLTILFVTILMFGNSANAQHDLYGLWAKKTGYVDVGSSINVEHMLTDKAGNVYVGGAFKGIVSLSENTCQFISSSASSVDAFISKYDSNGKWLWSVRLESKNPDNIKSMALSADETELIFFGLYAGNNDGISAAGTTFITYGISESVPLGTKESLAYTTPPGNTGYYNTKVILKTSDGSKSSFTQLPMYEGTLSYFPNFTWFDSDHNNYISYMTRSGANYIVTTEKYNTSNTLLHKKQTSRTSPWNAHIMAVSRNPNTEYFYVINRHSNGPNLVWYDYLSRIKKSDLQFSELSSISEYTRLPDVAGAIDPKTSHGIVSAKLDVNDAETHLFLGGMNLYNFTYKSKPTVVITNPDQGKGDGIIVCYDPKNTNGNTNMRWLVQLKAPGDQRVVDIQYDQLTQTLLAVGYIDENEVDFNPLFSANPMKRRATKGQKAMFYAVYDHFGECQYVTIMDSPQNDQAFTLGIGSTNATNKDLTVFGAFGGSPFQSDPSGRLWPLRTATPSLFLARYSTDPASTPSPLTPGSYGSADNRFGTYGIARHSVQTCLNLGTNNEVTRANSLTYEPRQIGGTVPAGANPNPNYGTVTPTLNTPAGGLTVSINATNSKTTPAYLAAWIDFNGNRVFDSAEVSTVVTIAPNASTAFNLVWNSLPAGIDLTDTMRYLRVRISSEQLDGSMHSGDLADGEVEDYKLRLPNLLTVTKTASVPNPNGKIALGDTITYTLKVNSQISGKPITVFDPIPANTEYVAGSARPTPTPDPIGNVSYMGTSALAVKWDLAGLTANTDSVFTFKVILKELPSDSTIYNIAFATMLSDTVSSADNNCTFIELAVDGIKPLDDYFAVFKNDSIISGASISQNDPDPLRITTRDTIIDPNTFQSGKTTLIDPRDGTIKYKTPNNFVGIDSVDYQMKTTAGKLSDTARVYIAVVEKAQYFACPGSAVTVRIKPVKGSRITYDWYNAATAGTKISSNADTAVVTMGAGATTAWIQVKIDGKETTNGRLPLTVDLADGCGTTNPTGCAVDGTLIFREDFGGTNPSDPDIKPSGIPQMEVGGIYSYTTGIPTGPSQYRISRKSPVFGSWQTVDDHGLAVNGIPGYLLFVNAGTEKGQFYDTVINNLCAGSELYFSSWINNVLISAHIDMVNQIFILEDLSGNVISTYYTGDIPNRSPGWKQYGFKFTVPVGITALRLKILNNGKGSSGNDFALDDIEVRLCAPVVTAAVNAKGADTICLGQSATLTARYENDGTFATAGLKGYWVESATGNINVATDWTKVSGSDGTVVLDTVKSTFTVTPPASSVKYYRFLVGTGATVLESTNCRAASPVLTLTTRNCVGLQRDSAVIKMNDSVVVDILNNDALGTCNRGNVSVALSTQASGIVKHGTAYLDTNKDLHYKPTTGWYGMDSLRYVVTDCYSLKDSTSVYLLTMKHLSDFYVSCENVKQWIGFKTVSGVSTTWYPTQTGTTPITGGTGKDSIEITKDASALQTFWAEPVWNGIKFPRIKVEVRLGDCGITPVDCAVDGTLLWIEDFDRYDDGLNPASPAYSREQLPAGMTTYTFTPIPGKTSPIKTGMYAEGSYAIVKDATDPQMGSFLANFKDDYTYRNDKTRGRFLITNGKNSPDTVYRQVIPGLCGNAKMYFSFMLAGHDGDLQWTIYDNATNNVLTVFKLPKLPSSNNAAWKHYGFYFDLPNNVSDIRFEIYNNSNAAWGNDVAYDDISVRLCAPKVTSTINLKLTDTICNDSVLLESGYTDSGTFINAVTDTLKGYWLQSTTGDLKTPSDWTKVAGTDVSAVPPTPGSINSDVKVKVTADTVYYRFVTSNQANVNNWNCRASSAVLSAIKHRHPSQYQDIRVQLCPQPGRTIDLNSYLDTIGLKTVEWSNIVPLTPAIVSASGQINTATMASGTYIYQYAVENVCVKDTARAYVKVMTKYVPLTTQVVICYETPGAERVNLNQIFGLEANGTISWNSALDPYVTIVTAGKFKGGYYFDAAKAWKELAGFSHTHNGDTDAKLFKFTYTPSAGTCLTTPVEVEVIVTKKMFE